MKQPKDFEELYGWVCNLLDNKQNHNHDPKGIGPLALYDISLAIGCNLFPKVLPRKYVYLHCNLVEAAKVLIGNPIDKIRVETQRFSRCFPNFSAMEIEDILCIYGDRIIREGNFKKDWLKVVP